MTALTLKTEWLEPGFWPDTLYDAPFVEMAAAPWASNVAAADPPVGVTDDTLDGFARQLVAAVEAQLASITGAVHCLLSGGYDSRLLAALLERNGKQPLYITDGDEEPSCGDTLDFLGVPAGRRYRHDLNRSDPYGLAHATVSGWAPIYHQMRFAPGDPKATLVTGLGGGEWFSYPAAGWHEPRKHRVEHTDLRAMWLDTWPQYWLLPDAWAAGYRRMINPYCAPSYADVAARCRSEWLVEVPGYPELDLVRKTMLDTIDDALAGLGWAPHDYDWRLSADDRKRIDDRYRNSWLARTCDVATDEQPSAMHHAEHACLMAGFAQWCDQLIDAGYEIQVQ